MNPLQLVVGRDPYDGTSYLGDYGTDSVTHAALSCPALPCPALSCAERASNATAPRGNDCLVSPQLVFPTEGSEVGAKEEEGGREMGQPLLGGL